MTNKSRHSMLSAGFTLPGIRLKAHLRVYTLAQAGDAQLFFSLKLWHAAVGRQARLAGSAQE